MSFWMRFAISEALVVVTAFTANSNLSPNQKTLLENFIQAGNNLLNGF